MNYPSYRINEGTQERYQKIKLRNEKKQIFLTISVPPKTLPKIVSVIVHRKYIKKRISKIKKLIPIENHFHKILSRRPYQ